MTDEEIIKLAHRMAWYYKKNPDASLSDKYTFDDKTLIQFVRQIIEESSEND